MRRHQIENISWKEVAWQRPFTLEAVQDTLSQLAALSPRGAVIWEVRGKNGDARHLLGAESAYIRKIEQIFRSHGEVQFHAISAGTRTPARIARSLKISHPQLSLNTDITKSVIRAGLAAISEDKSGRENVLQIILGRAYSPSPVPANLPDPHMNWLEVILGETRKASSEDRKNIRDKSGQHGFQAAVRLGVSAEDGRGNIYSLLSALRILESSGVHIHEETASPKDINSAHIPWHFPLQLSVKELAGFLLLPAGEEELAGTSGLHPKLTLPPLWYRNPSGGNVDRSFALSMEASAPKKLSISPQDALEHTILLGPTGSGKSTAMMHMVLSDIRAGRGVLVIDPKADLVNDILMRIPEERLDEVVVLDPSDPCPVGFNPLAFKGYGDNALLADTILSVLKEIFADSWGVRTADILNASLLTLAEIEGSTLLWLPPLLTDAAFRRTVTSRVRSQTALRQFWEQFDELSERERVIQTGPVLNKLRQFLLRPCLRNVLGQAEPKFSLTDLFTRRRIVLVPLNKGLTGAESARLIGSLIVGMTWTLALSRAKLPPERRHIISMYIDELQDYLSLPTDMSDALAQARGLGLALTIAHQYREQLPAELRAGVDANCRNKIVFGLNSTDARAMAAMAPELAPEDFMALPRYQIYTSFQSGNRNTGWVQGRTYPLSPALRDAAEIRARSMQNYGIQSEDVERDFARLFNGGIDERTNDMPIGRRKR